MVKSPEDTQYLALSIPHRLVVLALRSGYLRDHQFRGLHFQPELQPALNTIVRRLSLDEIRNSGAIWFCIHRLASFNLKKPHGCVRPEEDTGEDGEVKLTTPDCWRNAEMLFDLAAREKEEGVTGKMELCWNVVPMEVEEAWDLVADMEANSEVSTERSSQRSSVTDVGARRSFFRCKLQMALKRLTKILWVEMEALLYA